jgi:hypothetical protein
VQSQINTQANLGFVNNNPSDSAARSRIGSEYLLNSLKILRISDNFLPPLTHTNKGEKL